MRVPFVSKLLFHAVLKVYTVYLRRSFILAVGIDVMKWSRRYTFIISILVFLTVNWRV